jgi:hypothetical protein
MIIAAEVIKDILEINKWLYLFSLELF